MTIDACQERVRAADLVVLLAAFRRGWVPSPEEGGDGKRSIVSYELEAAERKKIPVLVLMASESWPGNLWEPGDEWPGLCRTFVPDSIASPPSSTPNSRRRSPALVAALSLQGPGCAGGES